MMSEPPGRSRRSSTAKGAPTVYVAVLSSGSVEVCAVDRLLVVDDESPPVALDAERRLAVVVGAERSRMQEREVGGVEEVVRQDSGADRRAERTGDERVVERVDEGCVVDPRVDRVVDERHPHETESDRDTGGVDARLGRDRRAGVECGDRGGPARRVEAVAVIAALDLGVDDRAGAQRHQAVRAQVTHSDQFVAETGHQPTFAQEPDGEWSRRFDVAHERNRMPELPESGMGVRQRAQPPGGP